MLPITKKGTFFFGKLTQDASKLYFKLKEESKGE
jgi:hypothetical protein